MNYIRFFKINLRIKSRTLNVKNIKPVYQKLRITRDIIIDIQTVKHVIHENSFKKNLVLKDLLKERLTKRYSI
jgi:hypothetical protein